ncbi:ABC transporter substrate-binding protein [Actinocrinis puniceicyclus]|uniref:ABC transporter substrate-binding protein n=1 Tax=Actinocrinis puniceicyclus TaxID=977794 RepID=A0A8J7WFZ5_9ACTN|nr:ABC transporter substrate-binding protein [Actinocrinis puniceicyclus]MBS2961466.1 ABC transporter substrate-binding protein [Actinocrinis puniceicyclus]
MLRHKLTLAVAALAAAASLTSCSSSGSGSAAPAQNAGSGAPLITVKVAVSNSMGQGYVPLFLAQKLGFFRKQGLDVQVVNVSSGAQTFSLMLSKQVQGVVGFYDHDIDLVAKGTNTEDVVQLLQAPGMVEVVRADEADTITSPSMLAGKNVGISGRGGSTEFLADYLAAHNGAANIHPVGVASGATFIAAMQHKQIDAGVTTEPTISKLLSSHLAKVLVDMRSVAGTQAALGGPYPGTALSMTTEYVNNNKPTVQKLVNGLVESLRWIQQHSAQQITDAMPSSFYSITGKDAYVQALANQFGMYNPTGLMPTDGPQSVFRVLSAWDPAVKGRQVDLSKTYTDEFVKNVPAS